MENKDLYYEVAEHLYGSSKASNPLLKTNGEPLQKSLFETEYEAGVNKFEKQVALYLGAQTSVDWWWKMLSRRDYGIQGWLKDTIYPDFLFAWNHNEPVNKKWLIVAEPKAIT